MTDLYAVYFVAREEEDLLLMAKGDKKSFKRILTLLENMKETPYQGIGKPEALKYELIGLYSRRIDSKNRLVYKVDESEKKITVYQVKDHY